VVCIVLAGCFAAGETAYRNLHRVRLQHRAEAGDLRAAALLRLLAHPQRLLSTILVGKNLARAAATILGVSFALPWLHSGWGLAGLILLTTVVLFCLSEVLPKAYAAKSAETVAFLLDRPLRACMWLLSPFVRLLSILTGPFLRILGADFAQIGTPFTEDEIRTMVDLGEESGVLDREETELAFRARLRRDPRRLDPDAPGGHGLPACRGHFGRSLAAHGVRRVLPFAGPSG